jgi:single-strand DNA-binding protein
MKGLNQVQLIGNLGTVPEMKYTSTGKAVATFSMATSRKYNDDNDQLKEETTWHKVIIWEKLAETCNEHLDKGAAVFVQGRINNRSWEDSAGVKHYASEVVANQVIFLDKPTVNVAVPAPAAVNPAVEKVEELKREAAELPF